MGRVFYTLQASGKEATMTLQNEHILMEEARRRVAERLHEAELDRFGRRNHRAARVAAVLALGVIAMAATIGTWLLLPF
jgi:hypothetical protein